MSKIHTVKKGETLSKIANIYGVTIADIHTANLNLIKDTNKIQVGWKLKIPSESGSKGCEAVRKQFQKALKDIRNVASVQELLKMIGD